MPTRNKQPKILVVDDRQENIRSINRVLQSLDAEVHSALSGFEALALLLRHDFSLILLDVMMPDMDGFETAELIRSSCDNQHLPIIFITACDKEDAYEFKGYEVGAVDYLFKPIQAPVLLSKVRFFLELDSHKNLLEQSFRELKRLKDHNALLLKSTAEGIISFDTSGTITFANPAARKLLGHDDDTLLGEPVANVLAVSADSEPESFERTELYLACAVRRETQSDQYWCRRLDGSFFPVEFTASPLDIGDSDKPAMVVVFQDISARRRAEQQLSYLAQYDPLTGLANRGLFSSLLSQAVARSNRHQHQMALLFLDLDRFKHVNDTHGHEVGDRLLQQAAGRLQACIREGDTLSRLGGDEFTLILEEVGDARDVVIVAEKLIASLTEPFAVEGHEVFIGTSIGIALYPSAADSAEALLKCADMAMYQAKANGRNNFQFFTQELQAKLTHLLDLENRLRYAVERDELALYYQPQVNMVTGKIIGLEALLRWRPSGQKPVSPAQFIPIAEDSGLILPIGEWVLREACNQVKRWHTLELLEPSVSVSVNLSVRQLEHKAFLDTLSLIIDESGLEPAQLELEITESAVMKDPVGGIDVLHRLHEMGIQLSLDDFGTGYSSLSYLKQLPLHVLKIDRSFIVDIDTCSGDKAVLKAIIELSRNLDLRVVAEGVETEEQLRSLLELNCHSIQGYFISEPQPAEKIEEMLQHALNGSPLGWDIPQRSGGLIVEPRWSQRT
jgi:diguanylate cyclase (GGDEF)-like protein/PAS domain S-box-containing protein